MIAGKRILIVGVNGFIGGALYRFIQKNYPRTNLFGLCRSKESSVKNIFQCDLNQRSQLKKTLQKIHPDYIFLLAGGRIENKNELFLSNYSATESLFDVVQTLSKKKPRILIPGTAAEYGIPDREKNVISESCIAKPMYWYGYVKLMQTNLALFYSRTGGDVVTARMFNISGGGVPRHLALGHFANDITRIERKEIEPCLNTKNLSSKRDYLDINDVCTALCLLMLKGVSGEIYNVCSGKSFAMRDLLDGLLFHSTRKDIKVIEDVRLSSESLDIIGSNNKLKKLTGWKPVVKIEESLLQTLNYYRRISSEYENTNRA